MINTNKLILILIFSTFCFFNIIAQSVGDYSQKSLIIKFKDNVDFKINFESKKFNILLLDKLNNNNKIEKIKFIGGAINNKIYKIEFKDNIDIKKAVKKYTELSIFYFVEPDYIGKGSGISSANNQISNQSQIIPNDTYWYRPVSYTHLTLPTKA